MRRQSLSTYFIILLTLLLYLLVAYGVERYQTSSLLAVYAILFGAYLWMLRIADENEIDLWLLAGIVFRISFLFAIPALSDDFYRFIWDGRLLLNGYHPFAHLPSYYLENNFTIPGINSDLFNHLNSPSYFTVYPPLAQFIFWFSVWIAPASVWGSVVVMRVIVLLAEVLTLWAIKNLLMHFEMNKKAVLIYALNPLVIIELTGNLHFEGLVIAFLLLSLLLLYNKKYAQSGIAFALSIGAKLVPLIFLPLYLVRLARKKVFVFYSLVALTCVALFLPFYNSEVVAGFGQSLTLYFKSFEFNASIYYLVREYGFLTKGYNIIQTVGWKLGVISTLLILVVSFWMVEIKILDGRISLTPKTFHFPLMVKAIPETMMWALLIYFLFTTTLHPWYITTLLAFSVFTRYRFSIVWTALIFLTYAGYDATGFTENLWLTGTEYLIVIGYLAYELIWEKRRLFSF